MELYIDDRNNIHEKRHEIVDESKRLKRSIDRMHTEYYKFSDLLKRSPHFREDLTENSPSHIIMTLDSLMSTVETVEEGHKEGFDKIEKDLNEDKAVYLGNRPKRNCHSK